MIHVYGGSRKRLNNTVREWLAHAGIRYHEYVRGDCITCDLKRDHGATRGQCLVLNGERSVLVTKDSWEQRDFMYSWLEIPEEARREG